MAAIGKTLGNEPQHRTVFISFRHLRLVIVLIIVVGSGILIAYALRGSDVDRGTRALVDAFREKRLIEPRLSGGFRGGRFDPADENLSAIDAPSFEQARGLISDAVARSDRGAELAYGRLLLSRNEKLPDAQKYLHLALTRAPESADAHNDLGVAMLLDGKIEDAIGEFETTLKIRNGMPEALFNRALCYQQLLLKDAARVDLMQLAAIERDKQWLAEIKQRLERVSITATQQSPVEVAKAFDAAVVEGHNDEARALADQSAEVLARHAVWDVTVQQLKAAVDRDERETERALTELDLIGRVLTETRRNALIADIASYLRNLPNGERPLELDLITRYVETQKGFQNRSISVSDALAVFEQLRKQFRERGNSPFEALAAFQAANCYYSSKRFGESIALLKETLSRVEAHEWPHNRASILNLMALQTSRLGQDSLAIKYFTQAMSYCNRSPQLESQILQYMSIPYLRLGDLDTALSRLRDSTKLYLEDKQQPWLFANLAHNYSEISDIYSLRTQNALALLYAKEALGYSEQANDLYYAAEFSSSIALEHACLNQFDEAETELRRATDYLNRIDPGRPRDFTEARVLTNAGEVAVRSGNVSRALEFYERARVLSARDEESILPTIDVLRGRSAAYTASGQTDKAYDDLMNAVTLIERYRANISASSQRSHFLDASHDVFDKLIALNASTPGRTAEAFEVSERARARALLEEIGLGGKASPPSDPDNHSNNFASGAPELVNPLKLSDVQASLDDDSMVVEYSVTNKATFVFLITRNEFLIKESPATTDVLDRLVRAYLADLRRVAPLDELNEKARLLYDYLIKPVDKELRKAHVCIVPDKALHFLPFAGLVDGSNNYFIDSQTRTVTYAPSASVLVKCMKESNDGRKSAGPERILAVGNPKLSGGYFAKLQPLADAENEASKSASFYAPGSVVLTGEQATEPRVRAAIADCDVAHLALHCLVEESSPWLAALVLAGASSTMDGRTDASGARRGGNGLDQTAALSHALPPEPKLDASDGLLYLNELYTIKLPRTRLVVLSACESGLGQYYRGEGIVSLVRPLLAAGVPTVVASLWPVDSQATSDLMITFHAQRKLANRRAGDALHAAQLKLRQSDRFQHPFYWAPFIVVGANN